jgi:hypothetical protein
LLHLLRLLMLLRPLLFFSVVPKLPSWQLLKQKWQLFDLLPETVHVCGLFSDCWVLNWKKRTNTGVFGLLDDSHSTSVYRWDHV